MRRFFLIIFGISALFLKPNLGLAAEDFILEVSLSSEDFQALEIQKQEATQAWLLKFHQAAQAQWNPKGKPAWHYRTLFSKLPGTLNLRETPIDGARHPLDLASELGMDFHLPHFQILEAIPSNLALTPIGPKLGDLSPDLRFQYALQLLVNPLYDPDRLRTNSCGGNTCHRTQEAAENGTLPFLQTFLDEKGNLNREAWTRFEEAYAHPVVAGIREESNRFLRHEIWEEFETAAVMGTSIALAIPLFELGPILLASRFGTRFLQILWTRAPRVVDFIRNTERILFRVPRIGGGAVAISSAEVSQFIAGSLALGTLSPLIDIGIRGRQGRKALLFWGKDAALTTGIVLVGGGLLRFGVFAALFSSPQGHYALRTATMPKNTGRVIPIRTAGTFARSPLTGGNQPAPAMQGNLALQAQPQARLRLLSLQEASPLKETKTLVLPLHSLSEPSLQALTPRGVANMNHLIAAGVRAILVTEATAPATPANSLRFDPIDGEPGVIHNWLMRGNLGGQQPPQGPEKTPIEGEGIEAEEYFHSIMASASEGAGDSDSEGSGDRQSSEEKKKRYEQMVRIVNRELEKRNYKAIPASHEEVWAPMQDAWWESRWREVFNILRKQGMEDQAIKEIILSITFSDPALWPRFVVCMEQIRWLSQQGFPTYTLQERFRRTVQILWLDNRTFGQTAPPDEISFLAAFSSEYISPEDFFFKANGALFPITGPTGSQNRGLLPLLHTREFVSHFIDGLMNPILPKVDAVIGKTKIADVEKMGALDLVIRLEMKKYPEFFSTFLSPSWEKRFDEFMAELQSILQVHRGMGDSLLPDTNDFNDYLEQNAGMLVSRTYNLLRDMGVAKKESQKEFKNVIANVLQGAIDELKRSGQISSPIDQFGIQVSIRKLIEKTLDDLAMDSEPIRLIAHMEGHEEELKQLYDIFAKHFKINYSRNAIGTTREEITAHYKGEDDAFHGEVEALLATVSLVNADDLAMDTEELISRVSYLLHRYHGTFPPASRISQPSLRSLANEVTNKMARENPTKFSADIILPENRRLLESFLLKLSPFWGVDFDLNQIEISQSALAQRLGPHAKAIERKIDQFVDRIWESTEASIEAGEEIRRTPGAEADPSEVKKYLLDLYLQLGGLIHDRFDDWNGPF